MSNVYRYFRIERAFSKGFDKYGRFVARHPWPFLIIPMIFTAGFGIGFIWMEKESHVETLYTPQGSQASKDRDTVSHLFSINSSANFYAYQNPYFGLGGDIIFRSSDLLFKNETIFTEMQQISTSIVNMMFEEDGHNMTFYDVCAINEGRCVVTGGFALTEEFKQGYLAKNLSYPLHVDQNGQVQDLRQYLARPKAQRGYLISAEAIRVSFHLREDTPSQKDTSRLWENAFLNAMADISPQTVGLAYQTSDSMNVEVDKNTAGDMLWISLTFTVMITYVSIVSFGGDCVTARAHLALAGVLAAAFGVAAGFGFIMICGVSFVNIAGVTPFLVLGKGIDDMFILMAGYREALGERDVEVHIGKMFATSGIAITVTTLTDILAFGIGAINPYISIQYFCAYTGMSIFLCYLNMITFFAACAVFHCRRLWAARHSFTCRPVPMRSRTSQTATVQSSPASEEIMDHEDDQAGHTNCYKRCCTGTYPDKPGDDDSICEKAPTSCLHRVILHRAVKPIILLLFAGYLGVSIWGATEIKEGLNLADLVYPSSYWHTFATWNQELYDERGPIIMLVVEKPVSYWERVTQVHVADLIKDAKASDYILDDFDVNWLSAYNQFMQAFYGVLPGTLSREDFMTNLTQVFLPNAPRYENDITFNLGKTEIIASRVYVQGDGNQDSTFQGQMMLAVRDIASQSPLPVFAYTSAFIFFEQYVSIVRATLMTCGIAVAAITVVGLIFVPHPLSAVFITLTMLMILVGMFAFMHFWGLTLNSVTMIQIVLSIGFCVDYSVHMCHAFVTASGSKGKNNKLGIATDETHGEPDMENISGHSSEDSGITSPSDSSSEAPTSSGNSPEIKEKGCCSPGNNVARNIQAREALDKVGVPILNSAISSLLGIIFLIAAQSFIFWSFFITMFLVIVFGSIHSFLFLPVVLSYMGPVNARVVQTDVVPIKKCHGTHNAAFVPTEHCIEGRKQNYDMAWKDLDNKVPL